jgi:hypothetical protein
MAPDPAAALKIARRASKRRCAALRSSSDPFIRSAPRSLTGLPVGVELGAAEPFEDLLEHHPSRNTTASVEIDPLVNDADLSVTLGVGPLMRAVRSVGISKGLPTAHDDRELVEPQALGMAHK